MQLLRDSFVSISMLSPTRRVIPLYAEAGDRWHTNIKLPDVVVSNESAGPVRLVSACLHAAVEGSVVASLFSSGAELETVLSEGNVLLNSLVGKKAGPWRAYNLNILFATEPDHSVRFAEAATLHPSEKACLRLDDLFDCHVAHASKVDEIRYQLTYDVGSRRQSIEFPVPLTPYTCKGDYVFPVQGSVTIESTAWNRDLGHRAATSQEFALDVVDCRRLEDGALSLSSPIHSARVSDYFIFNREVLAIGDGIVAACGNAWPDDWALNPLDYSEKRVTEKTFALLDEGMDFAHAILGNYVILDHRNGEFSVYAHMREGSVVPKPGDCVGHGDPIGRIGNTSNSETPHLHFHLMDSPDFVTANGLPVRFRNLPTTMASVDDYADKNPLLYSDFIFSHVPRS